MNVFDLSAKIALDINGYLKGMDQAKAVAVSTMGVIGGQVGQFMEDSVNVGASFDKSMSQVAATLGGTMNDLNSDVQSTDTQFGHFEGTLRDFAQYMGSNTAFSATQAADALNYMALAGYDTQKSMEMLPNVLNLAAAGNMDLAKSSDMVTDTQTAFGIGTVRTTQMVDEMAKAASTGNTSVEQLGDAFLVVGGLAKELNGGMVKLKDGTEAETDGVQELEIALTAMANAGVKGSEAGTHMRNMLLKLSSPTKEGTEQLKNLGVSVFDAEGKMRSLKDIFGDLNTSLSKLTQEEKIQAISDLFNTRDMASAEALLAAIGEDWDAIGEEILNAEGAASKMAEVQLDNLEGDLTLFDSALEGLQIKLSDAVTPALRNMTQMGTGLIQGLTTAFSALPEPIQEVIGMIGLIGGKVAEQAPQIFGIISTLEQMKNMAKAAGDETGGIAGRIMNVAKSPGFATAAGCFAIVTAAVAITVSKIEQATEKIREYGNTAESIKGSVKSASDTIKGLGDETVTASNAVDSYSKALQALSDLQEAQEAATNNLKDTEAEYTDIVKDNADAQEIFALACDHSIGSAIELMSRGGTLITAGQEYQKVADDTAESIDEANRMLEEAEARVYALNVVQQAGTDITKNQTAELYNALNAIEATPEMYNQWMGAIDSLNQKHDAEAYALGKTVDYEQERFQVLEEAYLEWRENVEKNVESVIGFHNKFKDIVVTTVDEVTGELMVGDQKFDESAQVAAVSVEEMIDSFKSQVAYMDEYAENIQKAMELGVDQGIIQKLSDGSVESAQILAGIVADGGQNIDELNAEFRKVEEGKSKFIEVMDNMNYEFGRQMRMAELRAQVAAHKLDMHDEAYTNGTNTMIGYLNGVNSMRTQIYNAFASIASLGQQALKTTNKQRSPSKAFYDIATLDVQGYVNSVKDSTGKVYKAFQNIGETAQKAVESGVYTHGIQVNGNTTPDKVASAMHKTQDRGRTEIILQLDGATLGRVTLPYIDRESQRIGVKLAGGAA